MLIGRGELNGARLGVKAAQGLPELFCQDCRASWLARVYKDRGPRARRAYTSRAPCLICVPHSSASAVKSRFAQPPLASPATTHAQDPFGRRRLFRSSNST